MLDDLSGAADLERTGYGKGLRVIGAGSASNTNAQALRPDVRIDH
uniref:Uncharacterized protein n=1 Tax=Pseudomonas fluorescens (strain SBW25) TaxID=216595 RepID=A0A0G4E4N5_PSEFS|nr:hypothetical protein PQBR57_0248 [Pseudomonas fluorescens SBW25]